MLKGINKIISPELLMILDKMGHGDEIVFSDGNFPGESIGRIVLRADACGVPELMKAVLSCSLSTATTTTYISWTKPKATAALTFRFGKNTAG